MTRWNIKTESVSFSEPLYQSRKTSSFPCAFNSNRHISAVVSKPHVSKSVAPESPIPHPLSSEDDPIPTGPKNWQFIPSCLESDPIPTGPKNWTFIPCTDPIPTGPKNLTLSYSQAQNSNPHELKTKPSVSTPTIATSLKHVQVTRKKQRFRSKKSKQRLNKKIKLKKGALAVKEKVDYEAYLRSLSQNFVDKINRFTEHIELLGTPGYTRSIATEEEKEIEKKGVPIVVPQK